MVDTETGDSTTYIFCASCRDQKPIFRVENENYTDCGLTEID